MEIRYLTGVFICLFSLLSPHPVFASENRLVGKVLDAIEVMHDINKIPESTIPPSLLGNAHGIAIIPGVIKVGFVVGGRHGQGVLSIRNSDGKWSNPTFVTLTGGSLGWQIGAQSTDIILVFKNRKSIDGIVKGTFTLGADAAVAAGPVGRHAEAGTDMELKAEIYSYSRNRGLFAGLALEGAVLQIDHEANSQIYQEPHITLPEIFQSSDLSRPEAINQFKEVVTSYMQ